MSFSDLHLCQDSVSSESKTDICDCPPEYVCVYDCPEGGYSVSTLISWQHFPRSTSSRSRCDDSEEIISSLKTPTLTSVKEEEEEVKSAKVSSTEYPITKSLSQLNALHYLEIRHVYEFFNFLIGHLVCNEPEDPVEFLVNLLDKCLKYRDGFEQPPMLFTQAHIKSLYSAFDPFERGYLTVNQYKEAMRALGLENSIRPYNKNPPLNEDGCVEEDNFVFEAVTCLTENMKQMLRIPKMWEENRLLWKKKMARRKKKEKLGSLSEFEKKSDEIEGEGKELYCKCSSSVCNRLCECSQEAKIINEPEQLFLN